MILLQSAEAIALGVLVWVLRHLWHMVGFALGLAFIPLLALIGPPALIGEPLGRLAARVSQTIRASTLLEKQADGQYQVENVTPEEHGPRSHWTRFAGGQLALDFERKADAFDGTAREIDGSEESPAVPEVESRADVELPGPRLPTAVKRGPVAHFHDSREGAEEGLLVNLPATLEGLRDAAGIQMANRAMGRAMEDYGGDSSGYGSMTVLVGVVVMFILGAVLGVVIVL